MAFMWIAYLLSLVGPVIVIGLLLSVGWVMNERGWQLTAWTVVGIPVAGGLAELVLLVSHRPLSGLWWVLTYDTTIANLGFAVVVGAAFVGGGVIRYQHWDYGFLATAIAVGALVVTIVAIDVPGRLLIPIAIAHTLLALPIGWLTASQQASATDTR